MSNDIDKYSDIKEVAKEIKPKKGSMGDDIKAMDKEYTPSAKSKISDKERKLIKKTLEDISKGYSGAEKEGFTHTNKAKSFNDEGEKDE